MSFTEGKPPVPERMRLEQDIRDLQNNALQQAETAAAQGANLVTMAKAIDRLNEAVDHLNDTVQKAKGALLVIGVISGAIGSIIGFFVPHPK
jgi:methyl-accepting chemotaxis protein